MFRRILIPTDLTDRTIRALEAAVGLAAADRAPIALLHVIETIAGADFDELSSFYGELEKRARDRLNEILASATGHGGQVDAAIVYGRRAEEVLRFARTNQIDLIVLASHPVDPSQREGGMGTMSYKLGILAPCSVLLLK